MQASTKNKQARTPHLSTMSPTILIFLLALAISLAFWHVYLYRYYKQASNLQEWYKLDFNIQTALMIILCISLVVIIFAPLLLIPVGIYQFGFSAVLNLYLPQNKTSAFLSYRYLHLSLSLVVFASFALPILYNAVLYAVLVVSPLLAIFYYWLTYQSYQESK